MKSIVYRQAAIDALGEEPYLWEDDDEFVLGQRNQWKCDVNALKALPSAQPEELSCDGCKFCGQFEYQFPCKVCIRREKDYYARPD